VGSTVYAATEDGVLVGSGSSWNRYLANKKVNGVTVSGGNLYASTDAGLYTSAVSSPGALTSNHVVDSDHDIVHQILVVTGPKAFAATPYGIFRNITSPFNTPYGSPTGTGYYPFTGFIHSLAASGNTLYAGTPLGLSYSSDSGSTWVNANVSSGLGGAVFGILFGSSKTYLATSAGFSYGSGSSWTTVATSRPVKNVVQGADSKTLYAANGYSGLLIIPTDSSGIPLDTSYWDAVLAGLDVAKVYVTVP